MIHYERRREPLLPKAAFWRRLGWHASVALVVVVGSLAVGMIGYRTLEGMSWVDAMLNSAMLLGGMGPVGELHHDSAKIFAACYALYAGIVFLLAAGVLFAPVYHRFLHRFHLEMEEEKPRRR